MIMTALVVAGLGLGDFAGHDSPRAQAPADTLVARGKEVYRQQRCRVCHSIEGDGNRRWPLDGVGSRLDDEALRKWIVAPQEMQPGIRKRAYDRLPATDVDALVAYLKTLKRRNAS